MQETRVRFLCWEDPLEKEVALTPVFLPGKSHGQRSLAGYSPWDRKELDMIECTHTHTHTYRKQLKLVINDPIQFTKQILGRHFLLQSIYCAR